MEKHDLLFIADATGSMSCYLRSLATSLPEIISISALTGCFSRIGVLAYRDYGGEILLEWSGWLEQNQQAAVQEKQPDLVCFAKRLQADGGGDYPEAVKTALAKACQIMREDAETLIFLYTDAPPHPNSGNLFGTDNASREKAALFERGSYSRYGFSCIDWISATNNFRNGPKKAQVFAILDRNMIPGDAAWYGYLATRTGGTCVHIKSFHSDIISKVTVDLLLAWMEVEKPLAATTKEDSVDLPAELTRYISIDGIDNIKNEKDPNAELFFSYTLSTKAPCEENITKCKLTAEVIKEHVPKKTTPVKDFAGRWKTDDQYKELVFKHLMKIIEDHVEAMTLNPVFGTMWRAICSDREYARRDEIVLAFNHSLDNMDKANEREKMKSWLEESYDFAGEIASIIDSVSDAERYPCVFLDPTLSFSHAESGTECGKDHFVSELTRADLLEIGRSCNPATLKRLGSILTQLTIVERESDMPKHISHTTTKDLAKIPLALASEKYKRQFWKVLFHLIKPGTKLSARPAALVAALSLRMGVKPLSEAAEQEMIGFKDKWNDLSTPETWSMGCLTLLIDADEAHWKQQTRKQSGEQFRLLSSSDRTLFERLVSFKLLELNLNTPLAAHVAWTPQKSSASVGPLVTCRSCQYPRSVTIMGKDGNCGLCLVPTYVNENVKEVRLTTGVSKDVSAASKATWVECSSRTCRAQYIVYNVTALNVPPKCHFCRSGDEGPAPTVKCNRCLNRMIWPQEYRDLSVLESEFVCPPCTSGCGPTTEVEVTANALAGENTFSWLVQDASSSHEMLFQNKSVYQAISNIGVEHFVSKITLFPVAEAELVLKGKSIHNTTDLISRLRRIVANRQTSKTDCSLCFSSFPHGTLAEACGRHGCLQRICTSCLSGWYGLNSAGSVINTAALGCPFCRRYPASRTLAKYGLGIHAVKDLAHAVRDKGMLIYAWCRECHTAKVLMERSCARGAPPDLKDWVCDGCVEEQEAQEMRRLEILRVLAEQELEDARMAGVGLEEAVRRRALAELEGEQRKFKSIKPCPKCGTMTMKTFGCGHMKCSVVRCGVDWCYFCGGAFDDDRIYGHMNEVHGGMFGGEIEEFDDEDDQMEEDD
ncbi:uncharacterized protein N7529_006677 [Penicillium soppii]|jgi:hypothetical protein|uniref:uncharacterized protein n=1 Tax=Penicillium soppii TaxID=69789 RepID=UPI002546F89D|nr:uncharacterized protein N7529_006677 [Penicillium soppii]KAJ5864761.1 hypothetical protein N7529_006677 [Penicillium soppii]